MKVKKDEPNIFSMKYKNLCKKSKLYSKNLNFRVKKQLKTYPKFSENVSN